MIFAEKVRYSETTHYDYDGFTVSMTLSLYNYYSSSNIISIYNWAPNEPQWWITGFDPNWKDDVDRLDGIDYPIDKDNLIMIGSVDLSQFSE